MSESKQKKPKRINILDTWISVKNLEPDPGDQVYFYHNGSMILGEYNGTFVDFKNTRRYVFSTYMDNQYFSTIDAHLWKPYNAGVKMKYFKINSLWKRQGWYFDKDKKKDPRFQKGRQSFIIGDYACDEYKLIKKWYVEEKIDGTNIRVIYENGKVAFAGRTERSQLPCDLLAYLQETFTVEKLEACLNASGDLKSAILFGEGFGGKIQAGHAYSESPQFALFDAFINDYWLERMSNNALAELLNVAHAPFIGYWTEDQIVKYVKNKPLSIIADNDKPMEGVVCRTNPMTLDRLGKPIIWKLKCKEF